MISPRDTPLLAAGWFIGFVKKTQKTPVSEIQRTMTNRMAEQGA